MPTKKYIECGKIINTRRKAFPLLLSASPAQQNAKKAACRTSSDYPPHSDTNTRMRILFFYWRNTPRFRPCFWQDARCPKTHRDLLSHHTPLQARYHSCAAQYRPKARSCRRLSRRQVTLCPRNSNSTSQLCRSSLHFLQHAAKPLTLTPFCIIIMMVFYHFVKEDDLWIGSN